MENDSIKEIAEKSLKANEETPTEKQSTQQEEKSGKMSITIFIFLLLTSIAKDLVQILFLLATAIISPLFPLVLLINPILCFIFCLPFTAFIFFITLLSGLRAKWLFVGTIIDQLSPGLPAATITVILSYILDKSPASIKKTVGKASKATSPIPKKAKLNTSKV
jgi:hypothetical protein